MLQVRNRDVRTAQERVAATIFNTKGGYGTLKKLGSESVEIDGCPASKAVPGVVSAALEPLIEAGSAARRRQQRVHTFSEQDLSSSTPTSSCGAETSCAAAAGCSQVTLSPDPHCRLPLAFRGPRSSMERRQHRPLAGEGRGPWGRGMEGTRAAPQGLVESQQLSTAQVSVGCHDPGRVYSNL